MMTKPTNKLATLNNSAVARTPGGVLARLWRNILKDNGLIPLLPYLVAEYQNNTRTKTTSGAIVKRTRSTLMTDITAPDLSFKKFNHLIFKLLKVGRLDITIKLTTTSGQVSYHTVATVDDSTPADLAIDKPPVIKSALTVSVVSDRIELLVDELENEVIRNGATKDKKIRSKITALKKLMKG